ncbi:MAG: FHA domain-containing protein, partial [Woeseiaceae bacterium]|nr:FHA domain-containing protein [Woeseiaceae bacterium]
DALTIGRATDQVLHLRDRRARLQHARIEPQDDGIHITTSALAGVTVNGRSQRDAELAVGDTIEVGSNVLRVIETPAGADFAVTFELRADASEEFLEQSWTTAASGIGGFSKRRLSWILAIAVLVFGFALPALTLTGPSIASMLRGSPLLPDDGLWLSGPVHSAHSSTATTCDNCHVQAFQRVPDAACLECHTIERHVADDAHAVLGAERCAACHLEHNEPPDLVNRHQGLCADCHENPPGAVDLPPVGDFLDAHPEFRVSLLTPGRSGATDVDWAVERFALVESATAERSNLKFDHAVHLNPDGIVTPDGRRALDCAECHVPEPGGARMQPVTMDAHCSGCHTLSFDADDPARAVPHGDPEGVVQALVEYYSARLLGEDPDVAEPRLRRPGRTLTREDRDRAAAEARRTALSVAADLFERQACATCHEVTRTTGDEAIPWHVLPVRLTQRFFPHARFSHASHDTGVTQCTSCHAAVDSQSASDLLMPGIATCRECHGSSIARRNSASQLPSTCIVCHGFHVSGSPYP